MITPHNQNRSGSKVKLITQKTGKVIDFADFMNEVIDFEEDENIGEFKSKQISPPKLE